MSHDSELYFGEVRLLDINLAVCHDYTANLVTRRYIARFFIKITLKKFVARFGSLRGNSP